MKLKRWRYCFKKEKDINFVFAGDMPKRLVNENKVKNKKIRY